MDATHHWECMHSGCYSSLGMHAQWMLLITGNVFTVDATHHWEWRLPSPNAYMCILCQLTLCRNAFSLDEHAIVFKLGLCDIQWSVYVLTLVKVPSALISNVGACAYITCRGNLGQYTIPTTWYEYRGKIGQYRYAHLISMQGTLADIPTPTTWDQCRATPDKP